jgi:hypothetical protein
MTLFSWERNEPAVQKREIPKKGSGMRRTNMGKTEAVEGQALTIMSIAVDIDALDAPNRPLAHHSGRDEAVHAVAGAKDFRHAFVSEPTSMNQ